MHQRGGLKRGGFYKLLAQLQAILNANFQPRKRMGEFQRARMTEFPECKGCALRKGKAKRGDPAHNDYGTPPSSRVASRLSAIMSVFVDSIRTDPSRINPSTPPGCDASNGLFAP